MADQNTHILAIPFPLQSHINPMLQLSKRLIRNGIRVTLVITDSISKILQKHSRTSLINIETVTDITVEQIENLDRHEIFMQKFRASITGGLMEIIQKYKSSDFPLKAIVYDSFIPWILDIAHPEGLKGAVFFTQNCSVCSVYYHLHKGALEIPNDEGTDILLPGMPAMGLKDLPTFLCDMGSNASVLSLLINQFSTFGKADWRLFNTFDMLEDEGLIDSEFSFIWVVRNSQESKLPRDFIQKTSEKGIIVSWCHQLEILSHQSVGCFITHCGWNSILEALSLGVPMVAMPQWSDQTMNAKFIVDVWKTGVGAKVDVEKGVVTRDEIVARLKQVMGREKGDEIRRNALKWKDLAEEAVSEGGSSNKNITQFVTLLVSI